MKKLCFVLVMMIVTIVINSCTYTHKESNTRVANSSDSLSLSLTKKAIDYAIDNKLDSLLGLFREDIQKTINQALLSAIVENVQTLNSVSDYLGDSVIMVSRTESKSMSGGKTVARIFDTFIFPFKKRENEKVSNIEIEVEDNKIINFSIVKKEVTSIKIF